MENDKPSDDRLEEPSAAIHARVEVARQRERFSVEAVGARRSLPEDDPTPNDASPLLSLHCNADMRLAEVRQFCALDDTFRSLMRMTMSQFTIWSIRPMGLLGE